MNHRPRESNANVCPVAARVCALGGHCVCSKLGTRPFSDLASPLTIDCCETTFSIYASPRDIQTAFNFMQLDRSLAEPYICVIWSIVFILPFRHVSSHIEVELANPTSTLEPDLPHFQTPCERIYVFREKTRIHMMGRTLGSFEHRYLCALLPWETRNIHNHCCPVWSHIYSLGVLHYT